MSTELRALGAAFLALILLGSTALPAEAKRKRTREPADPPSVLTVKRWLVLGPVAHPLPVFGDAEKGGSDLAALLGETVLPDHRIRPAEGDTLSWFNGTELAWRLSDEEPDGLLELDRPEGTTPAMAWAVAFLEVDRWLSAELRIEGGHPRRAWLDGEPVASGGTKADDEVKGEIELTTGKHVLLVETVMDPGRDGGWSVGAKLASKDGEDPPPIALSVDPARTVNLTDILDPPGITSLAMAPDGRFVATSVQRVVPGTDDSESWLEIRNTSDGKLSESWRGGFGARNVDWSPDGRYISYVADAPGKDKGASLFLYERASGRSFPLLQSIKELGSYVWSPTGQAIVYEVRVKAEKDKRGVKLLEGLMDRWAGYRDKTYLHLVTVPGGARRKLTAGALTTSPGDFSPDGRRFLFHRTVEELEDRPYSRTELWELTLETLEARKLRDFGWLRNAVYAPDAGSLLIYSDAAAFGDAGLDLPEGVVPNHYDGQLFLWDPSEDRARALTRDFDPAVTAVAWSREDGRVYLTAEDRDFVRLYRLDPKDGSFSAIDAGYDRLRQLDVAAGAATAAVLGSSPWVPQHLVAVDLASGKARTLRHPADAWFSRVKYGSLQDWNFTAESGRTVRGRVYLPPGFDASRKYPAIVYYYGGTSPVTREFAGRYPKEWWAANGYVVYVLQPTGATGFGQAASATHVNDWGKVTSQEIREGTRAFLAAHPFVDPGRVGCIGASYGGFMTMLLATQTDLFAAAVSHAGISSLASYWGEGYWGYSYSSVATADSFPWNRDDLYVDQSPLFRADQARVPILLTHGAADTNVPVGESDAFYIALKLLGKEVEYLQVEGQDHFIMDHAKRRVWSESIVAWFDRWLKGQPEWWNDLHPGRAVRDEKESEPN